MGSEVKEFEHNGTMPIAIIVELDDSISRTFRVLAEYEWGADLICKCSRIKAANVIARIVARRLKIDARTIEPEYVDKQVECIRSVTRIKTNPIDYAKAIKKLLEMNKELTIEQLSERIKIPVSKINEYLEMVK